MQSGKLTVGTGTPVKVPVTGPLKLGLGLKIDPANTGNVFESASSAAADADRNLIDATVGNFVPAEHYAQGHQTPSGDIYLIADAAGQIVYWRAA